MAPRAAEEVLADAMRVSARLTEATRELMRWEWDSRFSAVLGAVKAPDDLPLLELVGSLFQAGWDHRTLAQAPESVRKLASAWGGLSEGQRIFTLDPTDQLLFFAAWWPWGCKTTSSLRISCSSPGAAAASPPPLAQLRSWFSL